MPPKVLFVDDDANILDTFKVTLRKRFDVSTALGPEEGLKALRDLGPFAVIVSDLKMPGMDGVTFFTHARKFSPDSVRIILTGFADLDVAISAVNEGQVFRFLTKPCPPEVLVRAVEAGAELYRLANLEKELLRGTLQGTIKVLTEILGQTNPEAFGRCERLKRHVKNMVTKLNLKDSWKYELAAMLSQIGCIFIPEEIVRKSACMSELSAEEQQIFGMHPTVGAQLLSSIPRLEEVREMILHQNDSLAENPHPPRGSRLLKVCLDFDNLETCSGDKLQVIGDMKKTQNVYDRVILEAFEAYILADTGVKPMDIRLVELKDGMILGENLMSEAGALLLAKGLEVNNYSLMRLHNLAKAQGVRQPFRVYVPVDYLPPQGQ